MPRPVFPYQWGRFKPPPGSTVDPGHPWAQGLVLALLANEGGGTLLYDALRRQSPLTAVGSPNWAPAVPTGFHCKSFAADVSNYFAGGAILTSDTFSMLAGVTPNGFTVAEILGDSVSAAPNLRMDTSGFAKLMLVKAATAVIVAGATTLVAGLPYVAGCTHKASSTAKLFLNGYIDGTGTGTTFSHGNFQVGASTGEGFGFNGGTISFVYLWDGVALPDEYMIKLSQDIYGFIRRPARVWAIHFVEGELTPDAGALSLTGYAPAFLERYITPGAGALAVTGATPVVNIGIRITPDTGALNVTGSAPSASSTTFIRPNAGALSVVGTTPNLNRLIPGVGALTIVGVAPVITNVAIFPATGALSIESAAPTINIEFLPLLWNIFVPLNAQLPVAWTIIPITSASLLTLTWSIIQEMSGLNLAWNVNPDILSPFDEDIQKPVATATKTTP